MISYVDDGYIKGRLSVTLQVLAEINRLLKEDTELELNVSKTSILPKGTTQQAVFDVVTAYYPASCVRCGHRLLGGTLGEDGCL